MTYTDMIRKLTDVYAKSTNSNVGKFILLISEQIDKLKETFNKIESWRDVNQAEGKTLDFMGEGRGQKRGQASDEIMRVLIKARIARQNSDGTMNGIIRALALSLNTDPSTIKIKALYDEAVPTPAALMIQELPIDALNRVGLTVGQFGLIAQEVVSAGIKVDSIQLEGTFRFSSDPNAIETSPDGFSDDTQSNGGTLSATFDPSTDTKLPI
ncbi:DUF2612 domain-containing protein [Metabacillus idriensis]|uniref:DUF2612 domain-containing protein n=1 Tax=Metabacillus idriensis TaxID=324768 RepID=UPI0020417770|nr:DUF2612 domain-containing protein [Metabacillus idriensis]MCM3598724.1 DUF2612 domain-containing protein [Metabacillus idriensis]